MHYVSENNNFAIIFLGVKFDLKKDIYLMMCWQRMDYGGFVLFPLSLVGAKFLSSLFQRGSKLDLTTGKICMDFKD